MKLKLILLSLFVFFNLNACKYAGPRDGVANQVRVMFTEDPAHTMTIGWQRFSKSKITDILAYDTVDHGANFEAYANKVATQKKTNFLGVKSGFVSLKNLEPDTRYYFIIKNSFGLSRRFYTHTLPDNRDARISIVAGGDSRNNRVPRRAANLLVSKLKPHFVYFGGDMTNLGFGNEWNEWLEDWRLTVTNDGRVTPLVAARGNHERSNIILSRLFNLPSSNYYSFTVAGGLIRTYVLNSESAIGGNQTAWLVEDLKNSQDHDWRMAIYHKPIRPHVAKKSEGSNTYKYWASAFYEYNMDLVVESDAHTVKQTYPIRPSVEEGNDEGFVRDDKNGTIYIGEGCWGAPLRAADDAKSWTQASGAFNQFKWIFVDRKEMKFRTIKVDNAEEVEDLSEANRFEIPKNLDIWNPPTGELVTISND